MCLVQINHCLNSITYDILFNQEVSDYRENLYMVIIKIKNKITSLTSLPEMVGGELLIWGPSYNFLIGESGDDKGKPRLTSLT